MIVADASCPDTRRLSPQKNQRLDALSPAFVFGGSCRQSKDACLQPRPRFKTSPEEDSLQSSTQRHQPQRIKNEETFAALAETLRRIYATKWHNGQTLPDFPPRTRPFDVSATVRDAGVAVWFCSELTRASEVIKIRRWRGPLEWPHQLASPPPILVVHGYRHYDITVWVPGHPITDRIVRELMCSGSD
ncbi:unnamed protein product [Pleuronectes platessa]|uniref:Uncharacterized protein n=1 Tax=Pleuronectes platessa TaxID=8262 RepID=A0A9N7UD30_PLEPL|nr:unnamed protein product [Pleuronectes platessa]